MFLFLGYIRNEAIGLSPTWRQLTHGLQSLCLLYPQQETNTHYPYFTQTLTEAVSEWNEHTRAAYVFMMDFDGIRRFVQYP